MRYTKLILAGLIALLLSACGNEEVVQKKEETKGFKIGEKIELQSVMGSKIELVRTEKGFVLANDAKKILIFDIFGTFCQPCKNEASNLMDFQLKNADDVMIVALSHFETVTNEYIVDNFSSKYNAYYFIVNDPRNKIIVETILDDIKYTEQLKIPFKVVLKDGIYQKLTDIYEGNTENRYYIGEVPIHIIQNDIDKLKKQ
jgi:thiol-disulfide isomerase/thioredoxin